MYREWPFFRSLIDNAQISLGKSDLAVARLYDGLAEPERRCGRVFAAIDAEWRRTVDGDPGRVTGAARAPGRLAGAAPVHPPAQPLRRPA